MTQSVLSTITQKLMLTSIRDVEVTPIVSDGTGGFVRAIKVFGEGAVETQNNLVLEVVIQSDTQTHLKITTPEIDF